eukprot:gene10009-biopygen4899
MTGCIPNSGNKNKLAEGIAEQMQRPTTSLTTTSRLVAVHGSRSWVTGRLSAAPLVVVGDSGGVVFANNQSSQYHYLHLVINNKDSTCCGIHVEQEYRHQRVW